MSHTAMKGLRKGYIFLSKIVCEIKVKVFDLEAEPGIFLCRFTPESTRYLLLKGKLSETEEILRNIAATNKKKYPEEPLCNPSADGKVQQLGDVRELFASKKMCHRTLVSWYAW